jgi:GalNAc5-diNAcBac-PP-undecaprenol beta-1,3-glucosyltransferase
MNSKVFFSVIVPTYNRGHLIGETIETILGQDDPDFELLIIDDGSTDDTESVVRAYADTRIRYWKKANEERGAARNFGMKHARGTYALFFDSDDWMHSDHLSTLRSYLAATSNPADFIATKYQFKNEDGRTVSGATTNLASRDYQLADIVSGNLFGCLYTFKLANKNLVYHEEDRVYATLEDWMFLLSNLQYSSIHLIDKITITVRQHNERSMANNARVIQARQKATEWALKHIHLTPAQKNDIQAYSHYFCAIHYYLDNNRKQALKKLTASIKKGGPIVSLIFLLGKVIVGRRWVERLK